MTQTDDTPLDAARSRHLEPVNRDVLHEYRRPMKPSRVVDGDTYEIFHVTAGDTIRIDEVRLLGVDTHEIHNVEQGSEEYERGIAERDFVREWFSRRLPDGIPMESTVDAHRISEWPLELTTFGVRGSFGRLLADVVDADGTRLSEALFDQFDDITYTD